MESYCTNANCVCCVLFSGYRLRLFRGCSPTFWYWKLAMLGFTCVLNHSGHIFAAAREYRIEEPALSMNPFWDRDVHTCTRTRADTCTCTVEQERCLSLSFMGLRGWVVRKHHGEGSAYVWNDEWRQGKEDPGMLSDLRSSVRCQ